MAESQKEPKTEPMAKQEVEKAIAKAKAEAEAELVAVFPFRYWNEPIGQLVPSKWYLFVVVVAVAVVAEAEEEDSESKERQMAVGKNGLVDSCSADVECQPLYIAPSGNIIII